MDQPLPKHIYEQLLPVAKRVFWWDDSNAWLSIPHRFVAQVMIYADLNDTGLTLQLLGDEMFREVLRKPPPGVFDLKSWTFWHVHYGLPVPPLPTRFGHDLPFPS